MPKLLRDPFSFCGILLLSLSSFFGVGSLHCSPELPPLFGSDMVLQRDKPVPVWGKADPGERISVTLNDVHGEATTNADGSWLVTLPELPAGGPFALVVQGKKTITLTGVMVGDVWLCAGQSNMVFKLAKIEESADVIAEASHPMIRFFTVPHQVADDPLDDAEGDWSICSPETAAELTAIGYFFATEMERDLKVPVGLIDISWGSSVVAAWISRETLAGDPDFKVILDQWASDVAEHPEAKAEYDLELPAWEAAAEIARSEGKPVPARPASPPLLIDQFIPAGIYNGKLAPVAPFAIRGVLWYQGEENVLRKKNYDRFLAAMIADWRRLWRQEDLPFLIVQLPNCGNRQARPGPSSWAELREAQATAAKLPHTGFVVTIDVGERDVHPKDKKSVGHRLALLAKDLVFGMEEIPSSPTQGKFEIEGDVVRIEFEHAKELKTKDGGPLLGFSLAGGNQVFHWATEARIEGNTVILRSDVVKSPVAVRYGWANNPDANLYSGAGLPAAPFRTDSWK